MFKFIERFITRIVSNAINPEWVVRAMTHDRVSEILSSKSMRSLLVEEMLDSLDVKHIASCIDLAMLEEDLAKRVSCREVARWVDASEVAEHVEMDLDSIQEHVVDRVYTDVTVDDDDVAREIARSWEERHDLEPADIVREIITAAYRGM